MTQEILKNTLFQTIEAIKNNPAEGNVVFRAETKLLENVCCSAKVRDFPEMMVDEPPSLGGGDTGMNPVELIAVALGTCQEIMYAAYAAVMGIPLNKVSVEVKGYLNLQGLFAMNESIPAGYDKIKYITKIDSPEPFEKIAQLVRMVETHCPVLDTLTRPIRVDGRVFHNDKVIEEFVEESAEEGVVV